MTNAKTEILKKQHANPFLVLEKEIFDRLYDDIIYLRRMPGTPLNERQIAEEFGTSRTPVRKALEELEEIGLLERTKNRSSVVAHMTMEKSRKLYEARMTLEPSAACLAVSRITPQGLQKLEKLTEQYQEAIHTTDPAKKYNHALYDHAFHMTIINATGNKHIQQMYALIEKSVLHYRCCLLHETSLKELQSALVQAVYHHKAICHAFSFRMASVAREEMIYDLGGMLNISPYWK